MKKFTLVLFLIALFILSSFGGVLAQDNTATVLYWQAASTLNPYLSGGTKDIDAGAIVLEPLAGYDGDGILVARLVTEIPTVANGGVSEDLMSITWTLQEGIVFSDGSPLTSADVVFTANYCMDPDMGCVRTSDLSGVESVEALDDLSVLVTFKAPTPFPYTPLVGTTQPILNATQFADCTGANAQTCTEQNFGPIGTGPFMVEEFRANDVVTYVRNPNYREEGKPFFDRLVFKGGGDAESAARAVLETGEADYAWNLQISPAVLNAMEAAGNGQVIVGFATNVERLMINQTNPAVDLGDMRAVWAEDGSNGHPFLQDPAIWQAMSMAIDRNLIAEQLYGAGGKAVCNVLPGPPIYASTNNDACLVQDVEGAIALLDAAGIVDSDDDGVREKDGIPLSITYQTSTNAVRQSTQALIKQWFSDIGIKTELRNIDASVFFGGDPASPDTYQKFYTDVEMYTNGTVGTDPQTYMSSWLSSEIASPDNNWLGGNVPRFYSEEYDALFQELSGTSGIEARAALAIQLNDLLVQNGIMIPLVYRGSVSSHSNSLGGVVMNAWDSEMWNVADWTRLD
jgi:peptide/nickel transport system substrate-binding protein